MTTEPAPRPDAIARCLGFVGHRLVLATHDVARRPRRTQAQVRALELLAAACVAEAARAAEDRPAVQMETAPLPAPTPSLPPADGSLRGAWTKPAP